VSGEEDAASSGQASVLSEDFSGVSHPGTFSGKKRFFYVPPPVVFLFPGLQKKETHPLRPPDRVFSKSRNKSTVDQYYWHCALGIVCGTIFRAGKKVFRKEIESNGDKS
jgi:hypothetical protein